MKSMLRSYALPRSFAIAGAFSLSFLVSATGEESGGLPFLKIGARYNLHYAENVNLPQRVTILEHTGGDWYRCAPAPILPEGDRRQPQDQPAPPEDESLWINFSHVAGITEIRNDVSETMLELAELNKAITVQAAKVEERRKALAAMMKDRNNPDVQAFADAKKNFVTDQELLQEMKLKWISEKMKMRSPMNGKLDK
jgi:hypothetical protein